MRRNAFQLLRPTALKRQLEEKGLLTQSTEKAEVHFWTNSEAENAEQVTEKLWGHHVHEHRL